MKPDKLITEIEKQYKVQLPERYKQFLSTDVAAEEDEEPVRSFLVLQVSDAACPICLWDYDGWSVYPLARSLDDFLKGQAGTIPLKHDRLASPYKKLAWKAADDADED